MSKPVKFVFTARDTNQSLGYDIPTEPMNELVALTSQLGIALSDDFLQELEEKARQDAIEEAEKSGVKGVEIAGGGYLLNYLFKLEKDIFAETKKVSEAAGDLETQYLHRGDALNSYAAMPNDVAELFVEVMAKYIDKMRLFAGTNDIRDMENGIRLAVRNGMAVESELSFSYRTDGSAYPVKYWTDKAEALREIYMDELRAHLGREPKEDEIKFSIGIKDFSGVGREKEVTELTKALKDMGLYTSYHTHDTNGRGVEAYEAFIAAGGDEVHVAPDALGGKFGQPRFGDVLEAAERQGRAPGFDDDKVAGWQAKAADIAKEHTKTPEVDTLLAEYAKVELGNKLYTASDFQKAVQEKVAEYKELIEAAGIPGGGGYDFIQTATKAKAGNLLGPNAGAAYEQRDVLGDWLKIVRELRSYVGDVGMVTPYFKYVNEWASGIMTGALGDMRYVQGKSIEEVINPENVAISPDIHRLFKGESFAMPNPVNETIHNRVIQQDITAAFDKMVADGKVIDNQSVTLSARGMLKAASPKESFALDKPFTVIQRVGELVNQHLKENMMTVKERREYLNYQEAITKDEAPAISEKRFEVLKAKANYREAYIQFMKGGAMPEVDLGELRSFRLRQHIEEIKEQLGTEIFANLVRAGTVLEVPKREIMKPGIPVAQEKIAVLTKKLRGEGFSDENLNTLKSKEALLVTAIIDTERPVKRIQDNGYAVKQQGIDALEQNMRAAKATRDADATKKLWTAEKSPELKSYRAHNKKSGALTNGTTPNLSAADIAKQQPSSASDIVQEGPQEKRAGRKIE